MSDSLPLPGFTIPNDYDGEEGPVCVRCKEHLADFQIADGPTCYWCTSPDDTFAVHSLGQHELFVEISDGRARPHHSVIYG